MDGAEHRDVYIAAAVGGVGLVLVLLHMFGSNNAQPQLNADGTPLPSAAAAVSPSATPYTFNVPAYDPAPGIAYPRSSLPPNTVTPASNAGGCCDTCGPQTGGQYFNSSVAQFMTLIGFGSQAGA